MNTWEIQNLEDTSVRFNANIERLLLLINGTLAKHQTERSERYIKYFFEVLIKYLKKDATTKVSLPIGNQNFKVVSRFDNQDTESGGYFTDRTLNSNYREPMLDKIALLIRDRINATDFNVFYFILSLHKDSIRVLLKNESTIESARSLTSQFKFIADDIFNVIDLPLYKRLWYEDETYNWFVELYSNSIQNLQDITVLEPEIILITQNYVEKKLTAVYRRFLIRLSNSAFSYSLYEDSAIAKSSGLSGSFFSDLRDLLAEFKMKSRSFAPIKRFAVELQEMSNKIEQFVQSYVPDKITAEGILERTKKMLIDEYKGSHLKVILVKTLLYALQRNEREFIEIYQIYNQPKDSDYSWLNEYLGIAKVSELFDLIENSDSIIQEMFFTEGSRSGSRLYLYNFIILYLSKFDDKEIVKYINSENNYENLITLSATLESISNIEIIKAINPFLKVKEPEIRTILNDFSNAAKSRMQAVQTETTKRAAIDPDLISAFSQAFVNEFKDASMMRGLLGYFNLIRQVSGTAQTPSFGYNELLPKELFIKETNYRYVDFPGTMARQLGNHESISIALIINSKSSIKQIQLQDLPAWTQTAQKDYDIIISKGRLNIKQDFGSLSFKEAWSEDNEFKKISDYVGTLINHYKIFLVRDFLSDGYLFLNSKKLGRINQYPPPANTLGANKGFFDFSFIDLSNDQQSVDLLTKNNQFRKEDIETKAWVRITEQFEFSFDSNFNGIRIEFV